MPRIPDLIERTRNIRVPDARIVAPDHGSGRGIVAAGQAIGEGLTAIGSVLADQEAQLNCLKLNLVR